MNKNNLGMKPLVVGLLYLSLLVSGCSTSPNKAIEQEQRSVANGKVSFRVQNPEYQFILDKDNRLTSICNASRRCGEGHNGHRDDVIQISRNGFGVAYPTATFKCGHGMGSDAVDGNDWACDSRFYATSNRLLTQRIVFGVLTFGLWDLMTWTVHEKSFDVDLLRDAVLDGHLDDLQNLLFATDTKINFRDEMAVVYVDINDIDDSYKNIIKKPVGADYVVLLDERTNLPLYVLNVKGNQDKELPQAVNQQLSDFISSLAGRSVTSTIASGVDVKKLIPPEIPVPGLPPVPELSKSEYETKADFSERVKNAVSEREETIRKLQQQYQRDVYNRNQYVAALGESWQQYLDGKAGVQNDMVNKLRKNQTKLARLLYAINLGKFNASDLKYDAENQSLYFTATSTHFGFNQRMVAKVSAPLAKSIKETGRYTLTPKLIYQKDGIKMDGLSLEEISTGDNFDTSYTDINFKPESVSVKVSTREKVINKELSAVFKSYEQKPQPVVDSKSKEVWYIETKNRINAKKPDWYTTPEQSKNVIVYGEGDTKEEAMQSARKELAYVVKTSISSSVEILNQDNTIRSYHDVKEHTTASTNVELKAGDYAVYKQDGSDDGKYYVALCYRCGVQ